MSNTIRLDELLGVACGAARDAVFGIQKKLSSDDFWVQHKPDSTPVTEIDMLSHALLLEKLKPTGIPMLSEEDSLPALSTDSLVWVIDPLDGTKHLLDGTGDCSVMIGLLEGGEPVLGVVASIRGEVWFARRGGGAFYEHDGKTEKISIDGFSTKNPVVLCSRSHGTTMDDTLIEVLKGQSKPMGSSGLKMCAIAMGDAHVNINPSSHIKIWDTCAPQVILEEAGGVVVSGVGEDLRYNNEVSHSNGYLAITPYYLSLIKDGVLMHE